MFPLITESVASAAALGGGSRRRVGVGVPTGIFIWVPERPLSCRPAGIKENHTTWFQSWQPSVALSSCLESQLVIRPCLCMCGSVKRSPLGRIKHQINKPLRGGIRAVMAACQAAHAGPPLDRQQNKSARRRIGEAKRRSDLHQS